MFSAKFLRLASKKKEKCMETNFEDKKKRKGTINRKAKMSWSPSLAGQAATRLSVLQHSEALCLALDTNDASAALGAVECLLSLRVGPEQTEHVANRSLSPAIRLGFSGSLVDPLLRLGARPFGYPKAGSRTAVEEALLAKDPALVEKLFENHLCRSGRPSVTNMLSNLELTAAAPVAWVLVARRPAVARACLAPFLKAWVSAVGPGRCWLAALVGEGKKTSPLAVALEEKNICFLEALEERLSDNRISAASLHTALGALRGQITSRRRPLEVTKRLASLAYAFLTLRGEKVSVSMLWEEETADEKATAARLLGALDVHRTALMEAFRTPDLESATAVVERLSREEGEGAGVPFLVNQDPFLCQAVRLDWPSLVTSLCELGARPFARPTVDHSTAVEEVILRNDASLLDRMLTPFHLEAPPPADRLLTVEEQMMQMEIRAAAPNIMAILAGFGEAPVVERLIEFWANLRFCPVDCWLAVLVEPLDPHAPESRPLVIAIANDKSHFLRAVASRVRASTLSRPSLTSAEKVLWTATQFVDDVSKAMAASVAHLLDLVRGALARQDHHLPAVTERDDDGSEAAFAELCREEELVESRARAKSARTKRRKRNRARKKQRGEECVICLDASANAIISCGHRTLCLACAGEFVARGPKLASCPQCTQPFSSFEESRVK
jgi:hypothetical protein